MNIKFLLIGTSLSFIPLTVNAQCVATQDCATLGYTETTCNGSKGVKCPFGNKWFCFTTKDELKNELCQELGFTLDCNGTGYTGGAGSVCNKKYAQCNCTEGYEWKNGSCQQKAPIEEGVYGNKYYCNGQVVGVRASGMLFFVAIEDMGYMNWNKAFSESPKTFCGKGKLPTDTELLTIYEHKSALEPLFVANGGTKFSDGYYWSSAYDDDDANIVHMTNGNLDNNTWPHENYARSILYF